MVESGVITVIGSVMGIVITAMVTSHFARKQRKADTESVVQSYYSKLLQDQEKVNERDRLKIEKLDNQIALLIKQNHECQQEGIARAIEIGILQRFIRDERIEKTEFKIFILDDEKYVRHEFRDKFMKVSVVKTYTFETIEDLEGSLYQQPEILILDYRISGNTIEKLLGKILEGREGGYEPHLIIFSGMPKAYIDKLEFQGAFKFFSKDEDFVNQIVVYTMNFIEKKIKANTL